MKVVFLIPNNVAGGAERVIISLANEFAKKDIDSSLITFDSTSNFYSINEKVNYVRLNVGTEKYNKIIKYLLLPFIEIKRYVKLKKEIKRINPDCVISFMFMTNIIGYFCCKKLNIPIVLSERNDPLRYSNIKRKIMKKVYSKINGLVCQSTKIKKWAETEYKLNNIIVIQNPLSSNQISEKDISKENKIISVGRLVPQKNHKYLIDTFAKLSNKYEDYKLYIYGEGPLKDELVNQIKKLNMEQKILLPGVQKEVIKNNKDAKLFVLPSEFEGYPNVLIEAMANGIVSISNNFPSGSAEDIIQNGKNGYLFELSKKDDLYNKMDYCLEHYDEIKYIEKEAKKIFNKTRIDSIVNMWIEYIKKTIE